MNTFNKVSATKEEIVSAAMRLVLSKGIFDPSTEQIAEEAAVARSLVNYYFDSRHFVLDKVRKECFVLWQKRISFLFDNKNTLELRIQSYIDASRDIFKTYPYLEIFIATDLKCRNMTYKHEQLSANKLNIFYQDLKSAMEKGGVRKAMQESILIELFSITGRLGVIESKFKEANYVQFETLYNKRKASILNYIFTGSELKF